MIDLFWVVVFWLIMSFQWRLTHEAMVTKPTTKNLQPTTIYYPYILVLFLNYEIYDYRFG